MDIIEFYSKEQIKSGVFTDLVEELRNEGFSQDKAIKLIMNYLKH